MGISSGDQEASVEMTEVLETRELAGVADKLLEVQGVAPGKKQKESVG